MDEIEYEIIIDCARCREIVHKLHRHPIVALAGEGIRLGKDGPLMLLQIGTASGTVFLFDIFLNRELMEKGGLGLFLQSSYTQKVMEGCSALSAALHFQFSVNICNVFDTQVAHSVIDRHKGKQLPAIIPISELCQMYTDNVNKHVHAFYVKGIWEAMIPDFWFQRPMTRNMIDLAVNDVNATFPEVYSTQRDYIQSNGLGDTFEQSVSIELLLNIDIVIKELAMAARYKRACGVIQNFNKILANKYINFDEIVNEDVIEAILLVSVDVAEKVSPEINKLKEECILRELLQIECSICSSRDSFEPEALLIARLKGYSGHVNKEIRERANTALLHVRCAILGNVATKYSVSTPAYCLAPIEKTVISSLTSEDGNAFSTDPVIQHLCKTLTNHGRVIQFYA